LTNDAGFEGFFTTTGCTGALFLVIALRGIIFLTEMVFGIFVLDLIN